eukprot:CAMPEP_0171131740 /NCGR_PEP_ID=MMETSP0766_2-20121228/123311_1 /TAXON_ID=439317 /ORGANISM="Gambierdiscus australes, Strain CAWD 149" /LENGTH=97 /DNA_ID=CAMNT_0011595053 /DNA_START=26 /DNA_END=319 /DNA_ORIENTATION=-
MPFTALNDPAVARVGSAAIWPTQRTPRTFSDKPNCGDRPRLNLKVSSWRPPPALRNLTSTGGPISPVTASEMPSCKTLCDVLWTMGDSSSPTTELFV